MTDDQMREDRFDDLVTPGDETLGAFLAAVRSAYPPEEPRVGPQLAAVFAHGLGGAAAPAPGGATSAVTPKRGRLEAVLALRRLRAAVAAGAAVIGLSGLGGANLLPGPVQAAFDTAIGAVGVDRPGSAGGREDSPVEDPEQAPGEPRSDSPGGRAGEHRDRDVGGAGGAATPPKGAPVRPGGGVGGGHVPGVPAPGGGTQVVGPAPGTQPCLPVAEAPPPRSSTPITPTSVPPTPLPGVPEAGAPPPPACPEGTVPASPPPTTPTAPSSGVLPSGSPAPR